MHQKNISRRGFLGGLTLAAVGSLIAPRLSAAVDGAGKQEQIAKKPLIVYFSHSGHTQKIAEDIHKLVGGDILRIEPVETYPENYNALTEYAKKEKERDARPQVKTRLENPDQYGVVFLGYPNWWSTMPMAVFTFVEQNGLNGKTIAPFATHGGGGLGHSIEDLKKIAPQSKILKPLAINGSFAQKAEADVKKWIEGLGSALIMTTTGNPAIYPDGAY